MSEELTLEKLRQMGGQATAKKYGKAHYQKMAQKRWANHVKKEKQA